MTRKYISVILIIVIPVLAAKPPEQELYLGKFGAFYTKIQSGEKFEQYSRTGSKADIIVDLGDGYSKFVFWRGYSYLPYLETLNGRWTVNEIIKRSGDGNKEMPDKTNTFSFVRIIENSPDKVIIHWRYLPVFSGNNPKAGADPTKFIDEYYHITPDKQIVRTIKKGTAKFDDWNGPENIITEAFTALTDGFVYGETKPVSNTANKSPVTKAPVVKQTAIDPVAWWKFDSANGDSAFESVNEVYANIAGHKSLWRQGVSGTALQFDGYNTIIQIPASKAPKISDNFTLEAWVVIGAYPWNWVPIIQQCKDSTNKNNNPEGYYLGIDGYGQPGFKIVIDGKWIELLTNYHLERRQWYHIAASFNASAGEMCIYVDGNLVGERKTVPKAIEKSDQPVKVGKGIKRQPINPVRKSTFKDSYAFDGLIDEIKVYNKALDNNQILDSYKSIQISDHNRINPDINKRILPSGENRTRFGAYYTHLKFYEAWDNLWRFSEHPDIIVEFDKLPTKFVFWRGCGYIPMMVNEKGQWYSNEFNETWGKSGGNGCQEPMSDKESFSNHVRIIENSPARVVIHWRYPLWDVNYVMANYDNKTGWCDWSDWYYYIYPDGIAVKTMRLWTHGDRNHEWQESMAIFGPDQHPEDIIAKENTVTMINLDGELQSYHWRTTPPENVDAPENKVIQHVNYTGNFDPVTIGIFNGSNVYNGELTPYAVFPTWNHWPVSQMPSDGRYAIYPDRTAHSSLTHVFLPNYASDENSNTPYYEKILMEGMLNSTYEELAILAKSWLHAPTLDQCTNCTGEYDQAQRAFIINYDKLPTSFTINCSVENPLQNACFVLKNFREKSNINIKINNQELEEESEFKQGIERDTDGTYYKVIWIEKTAFKPLKIEIY